KGKTLFLSNQDYIFRRTPHTPDGPPLLPHERTFFDGLFGGGRKKVRLSDLKEKFYVHLPEIRQSIYESLTNKQYFTSNPDTLRNAYISAGAIGMFGGLILTVMTGEFGSIAWGIGALISGALILAMARAMPSKTWEGTKTLREILGFKRFMTLVEKDRIAK